MLRARAHSQECALQDMKHTDLITQIILMHYPIEEIKKDSKKENDLDWQKMTAIAEDSDHMNISRNKKNNKGGQGKKQDKSNIGPSIPPQLQPKIAGSPRLWSATPARRPAKVACIQELWKQGTSKPKEQKACTVLEDSDSSTEEEDNFEKVNYVSHARDRGTEAPLLNV